jgi:hypothetical protein
MLIKGTAQIKKRCGKQRFFAIWAFEKVCLNPLFIFGLPEFQQAGIPHGCRRQ